MAEGPEGLIEPETREVLMYHLLVQAPDEPLVVFPAHCALWDQSRGQAELTELVDKRFNNGDRCDHVVIMVHPSDSPSWECCRRCNEIEAGGKSVDLTPEALR